jgi:molybdopterin/thiamine biosynthesis adenylyltransferase
VTVQAMRDFSTPEVLFRYGAGIEDAATSTRLVGYHPTLHPEEWSLYLAGAERSYRGRGIDDGIAWRNLRSGKGVGIFFLVYNKEGSAIGGIRFHGPLGALGDAALLNEMATSSEIDAIREELAGYLPYGVLEMKGMWSNGEKSTGVALTALLVRSCLIAMSWLGAAYTYCTAADRLAEQSRWTGSIKIWEESVPFPSEKYRSLLYLYSLEETPTLSNPLNLEAHKQDLVQLAELKASPGEGVLSGATAALILDESVRGDQAILSGLLKDPFVAVLDHYEEQVEQLASLAGGEKVEESKRWAYYPWANTLVSILGPRGFAQLRLDRNHNKITRDEQDRLRSLVIGVVGASAGHSAAYALAIEGLVGELRLADFDTVELSNLNRIPARVLDLGVNKAVVCARRIAEIDPYVKVVVSAEGITPENLQSFLHGLDLVVEECDSLDVKMLIREGAKALLIPVIMETSDRGVLDVERFDLEPDRPVFHGRLGGVTSETLAGLTTAEKSPYVARLVGADEASARGVASLLELGMSISGWPQLGSEVTLGGATVAAAVRRYGTGGELLSGRVRVDLEMMLDQLDEAPYDDSLMSDLLLPAPTDPEPESTDPVILIVDAARRAPSGGNAQPWRFEASDGEIRFYVDLARSHSAMDIGGRGSYVAMGAAVMNARVRAAKLGVLGPIELFPEGNRAALIATMQLGDGRDGELAALDGFISPRISNRRMPKGGVVSDDDATRLSTAVSLEGARLHLVRDKGELAAIGAIIGEADRRRFLLGGVHQEMMKELRWPGRDSLEDGLDVRTLELDAAGYAAFDLLGRSDVMSELGSWRAGRALGMRSQMQITHGSALALISVTRNGMAGYVRGGSALERFWLTGEQLGISMQPVAPVYVYADGEADLLGLGGERHVDALEQQFSTFRRFFDLDGTEVLVMALRLFEAERPTVHSIRRDLSEVLSQA